MIFTARGIGWIGGSLFAGAFNIFESTFISPHQLMLLAAVTVGLYLLLVPWITNLYLLLFVAFISSICWAWIDVGANVLMFAVWKEKVAPWMQAYE